MNASAMDVSSVRLAATLGGRAPDGKRQPAIGPGGVTRGVNRQASKDESSSLRGVLTYSSPVMTGPRVSPPGCPRTCLVPVIHDFLAVQRRRSRGWPG